MQSILLIIPFLFYLLLIIGFFKMVDNIAKVRKAVDTRSGKYWLTEYNKAKMMENVEDMEKSIQSAVFYDVATASDVDKKRVYENNKHLHQDKFTSLGLNFPEWDRDIFS